MMFGEMTGALISMSFSMSLIFVTIPFSPMLLQQVVGLVTKLHLQFRRKKRGGNRVPRVTSLQNNVGFPYRSMLHFFHAHKLSPRMPVATLRMEWSYRLDGCTFFPVLFL